MKRAVVRLPSEVVVRLDLLAQKLRAAHPARAVSRAAVVRALVGSALAVAEIEAPAEPLPDHGLDAGVASLGDAGRGTHEPS